jgi:hypothetical protein
MSFLRNVQRFVNTSNNPDSDFFNALKTTTGSVDRLFSRLNFISVSIKTPFKIRQLFMYDQVENLFC